MRRLLAAAALLVASVASAGWWFNPSDGTPNLDNRVDGIERFLADPHYWSTTGNTASHFTATDPSLVSTFYGPIYVSSTARFPATYTGNGPWRLFTTHLPSPYTTDQVFSIAYNWIQPPGSGAWTQDVPNVPCMSMQIEPTYIGSTEWNFDHCNPTTGAWVGRSLAYLRANTTGATSWKFGISNTTWGLTLDSTQAYFAPPIWTQGRFVTTWQGSPGAMTQTSPGLSLDQNDEFRIGQDNPSAGTFYLRTNVVKQPATSYAWKVSSSAVATPNTFVDALNYDLVNGSLSVAGNVWIGTYQTNRKQVIIYGSEGLRLNDNASPYQSWYNNATRLGYFGYALGTTDIEITNEVSGGSVKLTTTGAGKVSMPGGKVNVASLPVYADNAAATTGGLVAGDLYRTSTGQLMVRY